MYALSVYILKYMELKFNISSSSYCKVRCTCQFYSTLFATLVRRVVVFCAVVCSKGPLRLSINFCILTLKVLVATIDALGHFETR